MVKKTAYVLAWLATLLLGVGGMAGEAAAQSAPAPYLTAYRYLDGGRLAGQISPAPSGTSSFPAVRNTYDANGRLQKVETGTLASWQADTILPASWTGFTVLRVETFSYDADGRKTQDTYAEPGGAVDNVTQYSYDPYNRLICTAVRMNPAAFGSLPTDACTLGTTGANGPDRITKNVYDSLNRLIQVRRAVGTSLEQAYATYSYTADSQQQYVIDANGNRSQLTYDGHDREVQLTFPSTTAPTGYNPATQTTALATAGAVDATDYEAYGYDPNGNRTSLRKRDATTIAYSHDALNRLTVKDLPGGTANDVYYDYDNRGLMLDAKFTSLTGVGLTYVYDFAGRKLTETSYGQSVTYQYDSDGDRTRVTWPDGYYVNYGFDGVEHMVAACENGNFNGNPAAPGCSSGATLATYGYDPLLRIVSVQYAGGAPAASVAYGWSTWDDLGTLTHNFAGTANDVTFTNTFTAGHQWASATISNSTYEYAPTAIAARNFTPNGLNQYSAINSQGQVYDARGNFTGPTASPNAFAYDAENRLIASSTLSAAYGYDPLGRRITKTVSASTISYLHAGDSEIAEYDGSNNLIRRFVPGPAIDEYIAMVTAAGIKTFFHADKMGSVVAMSDTSGNLVEGPYTYDPYGLCFSGGSNCASLGAVGEPFRFTGQRFDAESGYLYFRARMYDAKNGRFLQTDPVGYESDVNLYAYVGNDPTDKADPTGLATCADPDCSHSNIEPNPGRNRQPPPVNGMTGINPDSQLGERVENGYAPGPHITFSNDNPQGASPNQPVTTDTAKMVEGAVISSGVTSVNINSTTGGHHTTHSYHYRKQAVDINRVNGQRVSDPASRPAAQDLQNAFSRDPNSAENFGPAGTSRVYKPGGPAIPVPSVQEDHNNHVHESGLE